MKSKHLLPLLLLALLPCRSPAEVEHYLIDTPKMHAFITFKVQHLGFSWLLGRFNRFSGSFDYDPDNPANNRVEVIIDTTSLDTNHAERDKHLRDPRFFHVEKYPEARFVSTAYEDLGNGRGKLRGNLTLHGVTREVVIDVRQVGAGKDPWGGFRRGFEGRTTLHLSDWNFAKAAMLGPAAENIELYLSIEGVRQ